MRQAAATLILFFLFFGISDSQVIVYERLNIHDSRNNEHVFSSSKRIKLDLNGIWQAKFGSGNTFPLNIPFCTDFRDEIYLEKQLSVPDSVLRGYNFILYCESINYESEIKINDAIVSRNSGGGKIIITEISDNLVLQNNKITVRITNFTDNSTTYPLAGQVNYSKNYSGILSNIALYAVPKIYFSEILSGYTLENDNSVKFRNQVKINTFNIDTIAFANLTYSVITEILKKSDSSKIAESPAVKIEPKSYQNYTAFNELSFKNADLWSPEKPSLYLVRTLIMRDNEVIDDYISETGFISRKTSGNSIYINDRKYKLNGINYFEDQPKNGSALEYSRTEKDLLLIKQYGFNCIRIPGKAAHPFIIKIAQRIGLFVFEEIPFNEIPGNLLESEKYRKGAVEYLESVVKRDMNSPAIIFWGIGNDFDASSSYSTAYEKEVQDRISSIDNRGLYYTTRTAGKEPVAGTINIKGFNFIGSDKDKLKSELSRFDKNKFIVISSFGISVVNGNRNGFGDKYSEEFQAKFLTDAFSEIKDYPASFISSFADYNSEEPILNGTDSNPFMRTDGIFTYNREPKYSAEILKRYLNNQGFQKIPEGSVTSHDQVNENLIMAASIAALLLFLIALSKVKYFRENLFKCAFTPRNFYYILREQSSIPLVQNILVIIFVCISAGMYISSLLFFQSGNPDFDLLISKIVGNNTVKEFLAVILRTPLYLFLFSSLISFLCYSVTLLMTRFILLAGKKHSRTKNVLTTVTWAFVPLIILLPVSLFLGRILGLDSLFLKYAIYFFVVILTYTFFKLINGSRNVFELNPFRAYISGSLLLFLIAGMLYFYFGVYKSMFDIIKLIESYN